MSSPLVVDQQSPGNVQGGAAGESQHHDPMVSGCKTWFAYAHGDEHIGLTPVDRLRGIGNAHFIRDLRKPPTYNSGTRSVSPNHVLPPRLRGFHRHFRRHG
jgi:hypothetical protein